MPNSRDPHKSGVLHWKTNNSWCIVTLKSFSFPEIARHCRESGREVSSQGCSHCLNYASAPLFGRASELRSYKSCFVVVSSMAVAIESPYA